jgi:adrenodoxin-NADP+ reductase
MIDAYAVAGAILADHFADPYAVPDTILADHYADGSVTEVVPVPRAPYSEDVLVSDDVDLESVPREVEQGIVERRVLQYGQWKRIDAEEIRRGEEGGKERERMGWEEAREFLTSTRAW